MKTLRIAAFAFPLLIVLDILWIGGIASDFYQTEMGSLLAADVLWPPALLFYVLYSIALTYFAIRPAYDADSYTVAMMRGAFFGLITYAGYDLVNLATISGWSLPLSAVDLIYGAVVSGAVSFFSCWLAKRTLTHHSFGHVPEVQQQLLLENQK
jgi:uncharacterized membrane protein